ncbi:MAG: hypothetical protein Q9191_007685 [Dirinaria sp. TL-2023a]
MAVNQETDPACIFTEPSNNARHQVADNYQIANSDPKALDRYRSIEDDSGVRVGDLGKIPIRERAKGIASIPAPTTALGLALPRDRILHSEPTRIDDIYDTARPASLSDHSHLLLSRAVASSEFN